MRLVWGLAPASLVTMGGHEFVCHAYASDLQPDEQVILFRTSAVLNEPAQQWHVNVHGWVFEPEADSLWRNVLLNSLVHSLGLSEQDKKSRRLNARLGLFLVDNERSKAVTVEVGPVRKTLPKSEANGHFSGEASVPASAVPAGPRVQWMELQVDTPLSDPQHLRGQAQLIPPHGVSVISDIDDTIKLSNVLDTEELVLNTFVRPFVAVEGMSAVYRCWADAGVAFHYVSSSPWQLYPALSSFMDEAGFARGSYHLKYFRPKDQSFFNLFESPLESKVPVIESLLQRYPQRRFILVGDSGEKDAQVYARVLEKYPDQIEHVFIRNLGNIERPSRAYAKFFADELRSQLTVFTDPSQLRRFPLPCVDSDGS